MRIIPTRMGTSDGAATGNKSKEDHPHAYGDKLFALKSSILPMGSSPRVWGQVSAAFCVAVNHGIIPTRMGTSRLSPFGAEGSEDHPHAYGDKLVLIYGISLIAGSSPRVWGQVDPSSLASNNGRIIPTRMGTSLQVLKYAFCSEDHPHAYGDKLILILTHRKRLGSSPRVWGQGGCNGHKCYSSGIIPTRMGTSQ